jgi:hypothetical protein
MTTTATRAVAPAMARIAAVLREHEALLAKYGVHGIAGIVDYITADGYGYRYDADNPLPALAVRIGRIGSHVAGVRRVNRRTVQTCEVSEARMRDGMLLQDIANSIDSLLTDGEPVGRISA